MTTNPKVKIGIIGYGHLGKFLYEKLNASPNFEIVHLWNRSTNENSQILPLDLLDDDHIKQVDLVVEVAHPSILVDKLDTILRNADLFIGSPTCFADTCFMNRVQSLLQSYPNRKVLVGSGACWGANDIQKLARHGLLENVTVTMRKHPACFKLNGELRDANDKVKNLTEPTVIFEGTVRKICPMAPNNVNTMACAAIAASNLGFDKVKARLVSDPTMDDAHIVEIEAFAKNGFKVHTIRRNPAPVGAVTGLLTYYSFLASIEESIFTPAGLQIC